VINRFSDGGIKAKGQFEKAGKSNGTEASGGVNGKRKRKTENE